MDVILMPMNAIIDRDVWTQICSEAVEVTLKAIKLSEDDKDDEGVVTCLVSLYEAHRYAGNVEEAIKVCHQLSAYFKKLGSDVSSANYEKQAKIIAKGEPLNRIVAVVDGQNYELDGATQTLQPLFLPYFLSK
jgi:hypothetical protein